MKIKVNCFRPEVRPHKELHAEIIQCAFQPHVSVLVHTSLLLLSFTFIKHFYLAEVLFLFVLQQTATISELMIFDLQISLNLQCVGMSVNCPCPNSDVSDS